MNGGVITGRLRGPTACVALALLLGLAPLAVPGAAHDEAGTEPGHSTDGADHPAHAKGGAGQPGDARGSVSAQETRHSATTGWDRAAALAFSQDAIARPVRDQAFTDPDGRTVHLSQYRGRPLVVSLIFTSCYHVCPTLTSSLARAVAIGRDALGDDSFEVITIGFDTVNDTPPRMAEFARERGIDTARWAFLSADRAAVEALAQDVGFIFFPTSRGFDHLMQTTLVDAEGRVFRQIYGAELKPPDLVEPLKDLVFGRPGSLSGVSGWWQGLKLFCTLYDPASDRYRFNYGVLAMVAAAVLSLSATIALMLYAWLSGRRPGTRPLA